MRPKGSNDRDGHLYRADQEALQDALKAGYSPEQCKRLWGIAERAVKRAYAEGREKGYDEGARDTKLGRVENE